MAAKAFTRGLTGISHFVIGRAVFPVSYCDETRRLELRFNGEPKEEYITDVKKAQTKRPPLSKKPRLEKTPVFTMRSAETKSVNAFKFLSMDDAKKAMADLGKVKETLSNVGPWMVLGITDFKLQWVLKSENGIYYKGFDNSPSSWIHSNSPRCPYYGVMCFTLKREEACVFTPEISILSIYINASLSDNYKNTFFTKFEGSDYSSHFGIPVEAFFCKMVITNQAASSPLVPDPSVFFDPSVVRELEAGMGLETGEQKDQNIPACPIQQDPEGVEQPSSCSSSSLALPSSSPFGEYELAFGSNIRQEDLPLWMEELTGEIDWSFCQPLNEPEPHPEHPYGTMLYSFSPWSS